MSKMRDIAGEKFGELTAIERDFQAQIEKKSIKPIWKCECACGNIVSIRSNNLLRGTTKSCGCGRKKASIQQRISEVDEYIKKNHIEDIDHSIISLGNNHLVLVDNEDFEELNTYLWSKDGAGYARTNVLKDGKRINVNMQDILMKPKNGLCVLFKDKNIKNYRRNNLEVVERKSIVFNRQVSKNKKYSDYKGVTKMRGKWTSIVTKDGNAYRLGTFSTEVGAAIAYNEKAIELFGKYAWLNDIDAR